MADMTSKVWQIPVLIVLFLLVFSGSGMAQSSTPQPPSDDEVNAIAREMFCPVCENTPLDVCPTQACAEWLELIREKLAQGWNEQQIKDYFVQQFGDRVLASPPARGLNWLIYIIPPLAFIIGAFIVYRAFRTWKSSNTLTKPVPDPIAQTQSSDEYIARLEDELSKR